MRPREVTSAPRKAAASHFVPRNCNPPARARNRVTLALIVTNKRRRAAGVSLSFAVAKVKLRVMGRAGENERSRIDDDCGPISAVSAIAPTMDHFSHAAEQRPRFLLLADFLSHADNLLINTPLRREPGRGEQKHVTAEN